MFVSLSAPSSVLAFVTTFHLAMGVLRTHRTPATGFFSFVTGISLLLAGSPWLMPSPIGLAVGLATHVAWFVACERLLPVSVPAPVRRAAPPAATPATPRPVVAAHSPAPRASTPRPQPPVAAPQPPRRPRDFVQVPVLAVFDETPDIRTFRMARPEGFEFKAGQFVAIRVRADGKEHVRCYSVSSAPAARGHLEISVKRLGVVSGALHAMVRPGSMMSVKAPVGAFVYPAGEDRPIVLIAGGVGITPLMSMLRHAVDEEPMRPVTLFYSAKTQEDIAFYDELRLLNRRHAQLRVCFAITTGDAPRESFPGHVNEALLTTIAPDLAHASCFVCGPQPMIEAMTTTLVALGVPRAQIHFEIFKAAIAASAGKPAIEEEAAPVPIAHQARFERSGIVAPVDPEQTLLEAAEAAGAGIPSLCRAGVCGTCRTKVVSGKVDCASQTLDAQDREDGFVLPCVTRVMSDCTVDA
jgi:ferredoxin-NADP reductase